MIKANIMPIFNTDRTILLRLYSFFDFFFMFFDQKNSCCQKKHVLNVLDRK